jgi:plasmid stabilization system protein ParE
MHAGRWRGGVPSSARQVPGLKFFLHDDADAELDAAVAFYEACRPGLGLDFAAEVYRSIELACDYPDAGSPISARLRRRLVRRFPFAVLYENTGKAIHVIAVADQRRRPDYWRRRISP